ncbi:MAG: BREX-3 system phosphatase PglZ [Syntrophomonadaceae bacterium]|nr:BREX-3 system phosphatase PglZ [Syntrophomonadaceae bacterium]
MLWQQKVSEKFNLEINRLLLVTDPDGLLREESILGYVSSQGFEILEYKDPVAFRYIYEAEFREQKSRKLIVQVLGKDIKLLPFDVVNMGLTITLSLADFFPKFSYPVLKQLEPGVLGQLYEAYSEYDGGRLGDQGTREFVLQHIYELVPGLIKNGAQLLKHLIALHYRNIQLPEDMIDFIVGKLRGKAFFDRLKGDNLLASREEFWNFLQAQWKLFIQDKLEGTNSSLVPFEHEDIKVYMDNLFIEGLLSPLEVTTGADRLPQWTKVGIKGYEEAHREQRLLQLIKKLEALLEQENLSYQDWLKQAPVLAEAKILFYGSRSCLAEAVKAKFNEVYRQVEALFKEWLLYKYGTLSNLAYTKKPVMVHHIPSYLSYQGRKQGWGRLALLVLDGLAWDQWILVKQQLLKEKAYRVEEASAFAWVPTMTSVSRQAIFAGEPPRYFKDSLFNTSKEEQLWRRFWENEGYKAFNIQLVKGLGDGKIEELVPVLSNPKLKILGLVVDKVDKMVHGQQLGTEGMHQDIELWMQGGYLKSLLESLLNNAFKVFITSDHGNIAAVGQGKLDQGVLVDSKGERFRTYQEQAFLKDAKEKTKSLEWPKYGLPEDVHVLLAEEKTAYVTAGKNIVSHGGISLEEVIVPFIRLWKEEQL